MQEQREQLAQGTIRSRRSTSVAVRATRKPTIAAIRGYAFGGGALLALAADIRIAGEDARFKFHGASYGQAPGGAALPSVVGAAKAKELLFTGDEVKAAEALRIGLVNQVVPPADVLDTAIGMAERIAGNSRAAVALLKEAIELALPTDLAQAYEDRHNADIRRSDDSASRFRAAAAKVVGPPA
jgi:enoyl-CoA hydratase/carnithine racemase